MRGQAGKRQMGAVGLLLLSLAFLIVWPSPAGATSTRWLTQTYVTGGDCNTGDLPLAGGWHSFESTSRLNQFHPEDHSWSASDERTTICARVGAGLTYDVKVGDRGPAGDWIATCSPGQWLLNGGFGVAGAPGDLLASHPTGPRTWTESLGGDSAALGRSYALCATLPTGTTTYVRQSSAGPNEIASARCGAGDIGLSGGWTGGGIRGSHPTDAGDGWAVDLGDAGGSASAVCVHRGTHSGLSSVYIHETTSDGYAADAGCDPGDAILNAGWRHGEGFDDLRQFGAVPSGGPGIEWEAATAASGSSKTTLVLCGRLATLAHAGNLLRALGALVALVGVGLVGVGLAGRLGAFARGVPFLLAGGGALAVIGGILVAGGSGSTARPPSLQAAHPLHRRPADTSTTTSTTGAANASTTTASPNGTTTSTTASNGQATSTTKKPQTTVTTTVVSHYQLGISPGHFSQTCDPNYGLTPTTITLDNGASTAAASWSVTTTDTVYDNQQQPQPWATTSPSSGTIGAGQQATFQLSPRNPDTCGSMNPNTTHDFHVTITVHWAGAPDSQQTVVTDTVSR